jgi:hypothetical protein
LSGTVIEPLSRTTQQQRLLGRIHAANGNKQLPLYATSSFIGKPANATVAKRRSCNGKDDCSKLTSAPASAGALAAASSSGGSSCMRSADSESSLYSATETSASSTHHSRYKDATLTTICGDSEIVSMKSDDKDDDTLNSTTVIGHIDVHRKRSLVVDDDDNVTPTMRTLTVTVQVHAEPSC